MIAVAAWHMLQKHKCSIKLLLKRWQAQCMLGLNSRLHSDQQICLVCTDMQMNAAWWIKMRLHHPTETNRYTLQSNNKMLWIGPRHVTQISPLLFTGVGCSWVLRLSSSSTLLQQLWQIHRGTSPSRDWDREGTASASLRPGASRNKACESAGTASASLVPCPPGSPFTDPAPQSLNSRWHSRQQVCTGWVEGGKWTKRPYIVITSQSLPHSFVG